MPEPASSASPLPEHSRSDEAAPLIRQTAQQDDRDAQAATKLSISQPSAQQERRSQREHGSNPQAASTASRTAVDLLKISELAKGRLAQIARASPADCHDSYLFRDDFFVGVKYTNGHFRATLLFEESVIRFYRLGQPIGVLELRPEHTRAA